MESTIVTQSYNARIDLVTKDETRVTFEDNLTKDEIDNLQIALDPKELDKNYDWTIRRSICEILSEIPMEHAQSINDIIEKVMKDLDPEDLFDPDYDSTANNSVRATLNQLEYLNMVEYYSKIERNNPDMVMVTKIGRIVLKLQFGMDQE